MKPTRHPLDSVAIGSMAIFSILFGLQQVVIKIATPSIAPSMQLSLRSFVGLVFVLAFMTYRKEFHFKRKNIVLGIFVGTLFALEFLLLGEALRYTTASRSVVFLYTSSLFSAFLLNFLVKDEQLGVRGWLGIGLAFLGIAVAFLWQGQGGSLLGDGLALLAGFAWGMTTVIIRTTSLGTLPAKNILVYQLLMTGILLYLYATITNQTSIQWTTTAIASLLYQGVFIAFLGSLAWFWLLSKYRSSDIGALALLTPIMGVIFGFLILGEPLTTSFGIGAIMVLLGLVLVSLPKTTR